MASTKERARWEKWYDEITARMNRQKESITRLVQISTEAMAALEEIADLPDEAPDSNTTPLEYAQERARQALTRIKTSAASDTIERTESIEADTPISDPRSNPR